MAETTPTPFSYNLSEFKKLQAEEPHLWDAMSQDKKDYGNIQPLLEEEYPDTLSLRDAFENRAVQLRKAHPDLEGVSLKDSITKEVKGMGGSMVENSDLVDKQGLDVGAYAVPPENKIVHRKNPTDLDLLHERTHLGKGKVSAPETNYALPSKKEQLMQQSLPPEDAWRQSPLFSAMKTPEDKRRDLDYSVINANALLTGSGKHFNKNTTLSAPVLEAMEALNNYYKEK